jgi:hypothetical protein
MKSATIVRPFWSFLIISASSFAAGSVIGGMAFVREKSPFTFFKFIHGESLLCGAVNGMESLLAAPLVYPVMFLSLFLGLSTVWKIVVISVAAVWPVSSTLWLRRREKLAKIGIASGAFLLGLPNAWFCMVAMGV